MKEGFHSAEIVPITTKAGVVHKDGTPRAGTTTETLAGLIYDTLKRMPEEEEVLEVDGLRIIVKKMKGPKIVLAKVLKLD